jgi:hypothetical protein
MSVHHSDKHTTTKTTGSSVKLIARNIKKDVFSEDIPNSQESELITRYITDDVLIRATKKEAKQFSTV